MASTSRPTVGGRRRSSRWVLRTGRGRLPVLPGGLAERLVVKHTFANGTQGIREALADPDVVHALQLTAQVAVIAVLINLVFGVGMSLLLVRQRFPGKRALSALIDLPLSVSPVVVGLALVLVYNGRFGWFGPTLEAHGLQVVFAEPGMIMATCFVSLPLVIREVVPVLEELGDDQEQAARSLGANAWQTLLADHPARHQVGDRLRRRAQPRPVPRRVRRGQGGRRQRRRRDPGRHRPRPAEVPELPAGDGVLRVVHARLRGRAVPRRRRPAASRRRARTDEYRGPQRRPSGSATSSPSTTSSCPCRPAS